MDIDRLAEQVRRAAELLELCRGRLDGAQVEVTRIVAELDRDPRRRRSPRRLTGPTRRTDPIGTRAPSAPLPFAGHEAGVARR